MAMNMQKLMRSLYNFNTILGLLVSPQWCIASQTADTHNCYCVLDVKLRLERPLMCSVSRSAADIPANTSWSHEKTGANYRCNGTNRLCCVGKTHFLQLPIVSGTFLAVKLNQHVRRNAST